MSEALAERAKERERRIQLGREYVERLSARIPVVAAAVVGSVARGDFNVWSDVDVVVVAEELPSRAPERSAVLAEDAPAGVQAVGFTPAEFREGLRRRNPLVLEAAEGGVVLRGLAFLEAVRS